MPEEAFIHEDNKSLVCMYPGEKFASSENEIIALMSQFPEFQRIPRLITGYENSDTWDYPGIGFGLVSQEYDLFYCLLIFSMDDDKNLAAVEFDINREYDAEDPELKLVLNVVGQIARNFDLEIRDEIIGLKFDARNADLLQRYFTSAL